MTWHESTVQFPLQRQDSTWLDNNTFSKMSIGLATTCLALLLCTLMWGSRRIWNVLNTGKHWCVTVITALTCETRTQFPTCPDRYLDVRHRGQRRRRLVALTFFQTLLQVCANDGP